MRIDAKKVAQLFTRMGLKTKVDITKMKCAKFVKEIPKKVVQSKFWRSLNCQFCSGCESSAKQLVKV